MPADDLLAAFLHSNPVHADDIHSGQGWGENASHAEHAAHGELELGNARGEEMPTATHFLAGPSRRSLAALADHPAGSHAPARGPAAADPGAAASELGSPGSVAASFLNVGPAAAALQPQHLVDRQLQLRVAFGIWGLTVASSVGLFVRHVAKLARKLAREMDEEEQQCCESDEEEEGEEERQREASAAQVLRIHAKTVAVHNRDYNCENREAAAEMPDAFPRGDPEGGSILAYY